MEELQFQRLLALVNSALWYKEIDESLFSEMDDKAWTDLYNFAISHGVMAIAFDGVMNLPSHLHPALKLRMTWALSTEQIEHKYTHMLEVANDLSSIFKKEDIDTLVFKGLSLSSLYPIPAHREFGDIDIYLFGKHKEGDIIMNNAGAKKKGTHHYKHSNYYYKEVMIENHVYFLNIRESLKISELNKTLLDILEENRVTLHTEENRILFPTPDFSALFLIIHMIRHLSSEPLALRIYCDWALFLQAHAKDLNIDKWKITLQKAGLLDVAEALTSLTFRWLNVPSTAAFPINIHPDWEERISKEILNPAYPPCKSKAPLKIFIHKLKLFHIKYKRRVLIYKINPFTYYLSYSFSSFLYYIRQPKMIFKPH